MCNMPEQLSKTRITYFYGATIEEARDKSGKYLEAYVAKGDVSLDEDIISICVCDLNDPNPILPEYTFRVFNELVIKEN